MFKVLIWQDPAPSLVCLNGLASFRRLVFLHQFDSVTNNRSLDVFVYFRRVFDKAFFAFVAQVYVETRMVIHLQHPSFQVAVHEYVKSDHLKAVSLPVFELAEFPVKLFLLVKYCIWL